MATAAGQPREPGLPLEPLPSGRPGEGRDPRRATARTRLTAPAVWAGTGLLAAGLLSVRDPHVPGTWGSCLFRRLTGLPCPGCGGLRTVNDLAHGDVTAALASNAWVVLSLAGLSLWWLAWVVSRLRGARAPLADCAVRLSLLWGVGFAVFGVLRLLPPFAGLQPAP